MAVPVRRSRTNRSVRQISLVEAGTGRREPEPERPRRAMRVVAWTRATARIELGKSPSLAKAGPRRTLKKVADWHLPKEEVEGADETVEREG
jgi:hypothetical protein